LGKNGFVSVDYEWVNHRSIRFNFEDAPVLQKEFNNDIKALFTSASNIRAGIELKFDDLLLRGGFGFFGSPYKDKLYQGDRTQVSAGIGYRFGQTFVDFALVNSSFTSSEKPYNIEPWPGYVAAPTATIHNNFTTGVLTIGWKL
jgi:long-subunit fatty acid transport protein